jgi:signal transduction histidine kinase
MSAVSGVRDRILAVVAETGATLPSRPVVLFDGPVDASLGSGAADDLVAATRELLSNVVRHAHATSVEIAVVVDRADVLLKVEDDGVGLGGGDRTQAGLGLRNLATRAERLGGSLTYTDREGGGTRAEWRIPIASGTNHD